MKENYEIKFFPNVDIFTKKKDKSNEEVVHEIIDKFEDESRILKMQKLLIYFGMRSDYSLGGYKFYTLGTLKVKDTAEHKRFIEGVIRGEIGRNKLQDFDAYKYLIYLSSNIRKCDNKIFKNFTIAHELQHVLQFIKFQDIQQKYSVLFKYYLLKKLNFHKLPKECDAFIKSKLISYRIFGKKNVDIFTDERINKSKKNYEKSYWKNIKSINAVKEYDLENEIETHWMEHKRNIEKEIIRIKEKKENYELEENERELLNAYMDFVEECR